MQYLLSRARFLSFAALSVLSFTNTPALAEPSFESSAGLEAPARGGHWIIVWNEERQEFEKIWVETVN